jgi:hypothetical protein
MAEIVVSIDHSPLILAVEKGQCLLGFAPQKITGKPLKIFQGPETDCVLLESSLVNAAKSLTTVRIQVVLYENGGQSNLMEVSCKHCTFQNIACCRLTITYSACVTFTSLAHETSCWALVSAQAPNLVEAVSQRYKLAFCISETEMMGTGKQTWMRWVEEPARLRAILKFAAEGRRAHDTFNISPSSPCSTLLLAQQPVEIACIPVVPAPNYSVEHILLRFSLAMPPPVRVHRQHRPRRRSTTLLQFTKEPLLPSPPRLRPLARCDAATTARRAAEAAASLYDDSGYSSSSESFADRQENADDTDDHLPRISLSALARSWRRGDTSDLESGRFRLREARLVRIARVPSE